MALPAVLGLLRMSDRGSAFFLSPGTFFTLNIMDSTQPEGILAPVFFDKV